MEAPPAEESSQPEEVFEHIPWAQLAEPSPEKRPWVVYLAAGAITVAALGALAARSIGRTPDSPPATIPATAPLPVVTTPPTTIPTAAEPLSEADLLAVTPGSAELSAAARAEWFVTDYFSTGGDPGSHQPVLDALPDSSRLPPGPEEGLSSYVEWAATACIEAIGRGLFRSTVLFRLLASETDGGYVRLPVQAVEVVVDVDARGGSRVVDLPMPVALPDRPASPTWAEPAGDVPDPVRTAALRVAATWGADASLLEGSEREGGWRVVVGVVDQAGIRWPLALWLTELGEPIWP